MEGLHREHVSEDQRHEGWSEATPGSPWNPRRLEVRMTKYDTFVNPSPISHITSQIGMFSYVGLTKDQCVWLQKARSIYLLKSSRISMCGVTPDNIDYLAKAISEAVARGQ